MELSFLEKVAINNGDNDKKVGAKTKHQLDNILSFMETRKSYKTLDDVMKRSIIHCDDAFFMRRAGQVVLRLKPHPARSPRGILVLRTE